MPCTKHDHAFGRSPSSQKEPSMSESHNLIVCHETRLERAYPRVVFLAACLVYVTTTLLAFQMSIVSVSNLLWPEYERVYDELQAHSSALRKEQIVYSRLGNILSSQLNRGFMENHEDCLVRSLREADHELLGLGFRYSDVREQVMEWAMESCGRLQYAPQVLAENTTPQEAVLTYWASVRYRARQMAGEALGFVKQKLGWVFSCLVGSSRCAEPPFRTHNATAGEDAQTDEAIVPERVLPQVPFGFALECHTGQPCRLFYPGDSTVHVQPSVSPELVATLKKRSAQLYAFGSTLDRFGMVVTKLVRAVACFEILFLLLSAIVFLNTIIARTEPTCPRPKKEETYLIQSMALEHMSAAALFMLGKYPRTFSSIEAALIFALFMTAIGLNMVLKLFIPGSQLETIFNMYASLRDLYSIARGSDIMAAAHSSPATENGNVKHEAQDNYPGTNTPSPADEETLDFSSTYAQCKPHHRLANPTTTVQQDIRRARHIIRQGHVQKRVADWTDVHTGFETDAESDNDNDAFVHIAKDTITHDPNAPDAEPAWLMI